jgi:hypothetical protein
MKPPLPRIQTELPRTLHARLEIVKAVRTLIGPAEPEVARQQRDEIAALRRDLEAFKDEIRQAFAEAAVLAKAELRATLKKYRFDRSRALPGHAGGKPWPDNSENPFRKASADDPEHPGWPAGTPGGRGGKFRPKDDNAATTHLAGLGDEANDNLTPDETCQRAYSDAVARARINRSLTPEEYVKVRKENAEYLELCLNLAHGSRPIYKTGDFIYFYGGGVVIFRRDRPPLYNPSVGGQ